MDFRDLAFFVTNLHRHHHQAMQYFELLSYRLQASAAILHPCVLLVEPMQALQRIQDLGLQLIYEPAIRMVSRNCN